MDLLNYTRFSKIFISTILIASFFFWETDYLNLNFRYFFLLLILYNFLDFSKSDIKIYLYILCIPVIIYIHSILSLESKLLDNRYYLSLIFASQCHTQQALSFFQLSFHRLMVDEVFVMNLLVLLPRKAAQQI